MTVFDNRFFLQINKKAPLQEGGNSTIAFYYSLIWPRAEEVLLFARLAEVAIYVAAGAIIAWAVK